MDRATRTALICIAAGLLALLGSAAWLWQISAPNTPAPMGEPVAQPTPALPQAPAVRAQRAQVGALRIPEAFEDVLIREAQRQFGLAAPVAALAAQLHQESAWRPDARSPYAIGLAQFTPGTAGDMAKRYPSELAPAAPLDPRWSIRAQVFYMRDLNRQAGRFAADACESWAFALSGYNGGSGWWPRDRKLAAAAGRDDTRWWDHVEHHTNRSAAARKENREYPVRILRTLQPRYAAGGAPGQWVCA